MKRLIPLLLVVCASAASAQQNLAAMNAQPAPPLKVRSLALGSGIANAFPTNDNAYDNAWSVGNGMYQVPGYMPYYPTAATIWPRVVDVKCVNGLCDGYNVTPALGRGEYLYIRGIDATPQPIDEKITLGADALFDFDMATLKPGGSAKLDDLATQLQDVKNANITIVGYTDTIGAADYNDRLSLRRAQAVRTYLIGKGVTSHISAFGRGKTNPVVNGCPTGKSAASINCQAPNRRVEIQVSGTK